MKGQGKRRHDDEAAVERRCSRQRKAAVPAGGKHLMIWNINGAAVRAGKLPMAFVFTNNNERILSTCRSRLRRARRRPRRPRNRHGRSIRPGVAVMTGF
jgi:hypothetical protein